MKHFKIVLALLLLFLLSSCVPRAVREQQTKLCEDLATLTGAIAAVRRVSHASTATVTTLRQAEERVSEAFNNLKESIRDSQEEEIKDLEAAYKNLDKTIKEIPEQSTPAQIKAFVVDKAETLERVLFTKKSALRCSPS